MSRHLLFLDIDGVLTTPETRIVSEAYHRRTGRWPSEPEINRLAFDPELVERLCDWLDRYPKIQIVIASYWRVSVGSFIGMLATMALADQRLVPRIVGMLDIVGPIRGADGKFVMENRSALAHRWLSKHRPGCIVNMPANPTFRNADREISAVALDDTPGHWPDFPLVAPDGAFGVTVDDLTACTVILGV